MKSRRKTGIRLEVPIQSSSEKRPPDEPVELILPVNPGNCPDYVTSQELLIKHNELLKSQPLEHDKRFSCY